MQVIPVSQKLQTLHTWFVTRGLYRMSETVDILTLSHVWARSEENWLKGISNCLLQMLYDPRCCAKAWITSLRSSAPISSWTSSIFASLSCVSEAGLSVNDYNGYSCIDSSLIYLFFSVAVIVLRRKEGGRKSWSNLLLARCRKYRERISSSALPVLSAVHCLLIKRNLRQFSDWISTNVFPVASFT